MRDQIDAAVVAALEWHDNHSRARGRVPLTARERTAALGSALDSAALCGTALQPGGGGWRPRQVLCGDGQRVGRHGGALRCHLGWCRAPQLSAAAVRLLLQPAAVVEQARDAAVRALTPGRAEAPKLVRRRNEAGRSALPGVSALIADAMR